MSVPEFACFLFCSWALALYLLPVHGNRPSYRAASIIATVVTFVVDLLV